MSRLFFILMFVSVASVSIFSQTKQIEKLQEQQKILLEDIKNTNKLFLDVKKQTTTILQRINLINKQIEARKEMIALQNREITELEKEQIKLENEIVRLNKELKKNQDNYANAVRTIQNNRSRQNELFFVLSGKSLGESLRRLQYLREYSKWRKQQSEDIKIQNKELNEKKVALDLAKTEKQRLLNSLQEEQKKLTNEEATRKTEMADAKGKQQDLQKQLQNKQQQSRKLDSQIEKLIAEEVARQERAAEERRRAEIARKEAARKAAEQKMAEQKMAEQKYTERKTKPRRTKSTEKKTEPIETELAKREEIAAPIQPGPKIESPAEIDETFALSKNFVANKGKLPMPVTGTSTVVSQFGINRHNEWNISTNSNGIDIQAQSGANVRSVFEGEVSKIFPFAGMNTCVIVRHGDYYTFYANIYDLFVKPGDKVKTGQSLGRIYTDPDTGIASMHFQLWQKTTKLNPTPWLKR